jgi:hypothetical protein
MPTWREPRSDAPAGPRPLGGGEEADARFAVLLRGAARSGDRTRFDQVFDEWIAVVHAETRLECGDPAEARRRVWRRMSGAVEKARSA